MSEEAKRREDLEIMIAGYASDMDANETIDSYLKSREGKEIESSFKMDVDGNGKRKNVVEKEGYYYVVEEDENGNYKVEKLTDEQMGEKIEILTSENFDGNGKMEFNPGEGKKETLVFGDEIKEGEFCFDIQSGEVTIYIDYDMNLTNQGLKRSAINIEPKAKLNLYIEEGARLVVNSGFGAPGAPSDAGSETAAIGTHGGYAGIRVPLGAELVLRGNGYLEARGGNAGDGGGTTNATLGGAGGGGAGAGIGRKWWKWTVMGVLWIKQDFTYQ